MRVKVGNTLWGGKFFNLITDFQVLQHIQICKSDIKLQNPRHLLHTCHIVKVKKRLEEKACDGRVILLSNNSDFFWRF